MSNEDVVETLMRMGVESIGIPPENLWDLAVKLVAESEKKSNEIFNIDQYYTDF